VVEVAAVTAAREEILGRVRSALAGAPAEVEVPRAYRRSSDDPDAVVVERFSARVSEYRATVRRVERGSVAAAAGELCRARGLLRLVAPADLPAEWRPEGVEVVSDDGFSPAELDEIGAVLTGCALGIAETGTFVLDGGTAQGRRAITLVPDYHLCVIEARQIVAGVPEAFEQLAPTIRDERRPVTLVSGPSATSDIELTRVEGVHGPRTLDVLVVG